MKRPGQRRASVERCGFTLLEVSICTVLLLVFMAIAAQTLARLTGQRIASERRQWAVQEAANVMERLAVLSWDELESDRAEQIAFCSSAASTLPQGSVKAEVVSQPGELPSKRVLVEVRWQAKPGQTAAPVRLVWWVHREPGASE